MNLRGLIELAQKASYIDSNPKVFVRVFNNDTESLEEYPIMKAEYNDKDNEIYLVTISQLEMAKQRELKAVAFWKGSIDDYSEVDNRSIYYQVVGDKEW
jgi:hypothetical protein